MSNYKKCLSEIPHIEEVSWKFPHCTENEHGLDTLEHIQSRSFFMFYPTSQQHPADWGFLLRVPNILFFPNSQSTVIWWLLSFCKKYIRRVFSFHLLSSTIAQWEALLPVSMTSQVLLTLSSFCAIQILAPVVFLLVSTSCSMHTSHNTSKAFILTKQSFITSNNKPHTVGPFCSTQIHLHHAWANFHYTCISSLFFKCEINFHSVIFPLNLKLT